MKRFVFFLFLLLISLQVFSGKAQERRVYYLDVTSSMDKPEYGGRAKFWKDVKEDLVKSIEAIEDQNTEIVIATFTDKAHPISIVGKRIYKATDEDKTELKKEILALETRADKTHIDRPFSDFYKKYVSDDVRTYFFVITDGKQSGGNEDLISEIRKWNSQTKNKPIYGFYVMLKDSIDREVCEDINNQKQLWYVHSADVNINLIRFENNCTFNVKDDKYIDIPVSGNIEGITFEFQSRNSHYKVTKKQQSNDYVRLNISPSSDLSLLPEEEDLEVCISAKGKKEYDFLVTDRIIVKCKNKKIKSIRPTFNKGKNIEKLGKVKYHSKFLWSKELTQPLTDTLHVQFSSFAKESRCYAEFQFVDKEGNPISDDELHIFVDGRELKNHKFKVQYHDEDIVLTFQYEPTAKSGKHQGWLKLINHNLDQDGDTELKSQENNSLQWQIRYEKNLNPLAKGLMWFGIILLTCLFIWFVFLKPIKYPKFKAYRKSFLVSQNGQVVYNKTCQFRGSRMVVFANKKEPQTLINRIFTGRIDTYVNPIFTQKIIFIPKKKGKSAFVKAVGYSINPNPMPRNGLATISKENDILINVR